MATNMKVKTVEFKIISLLLSILSLITLAWKDPASAQTKPQDSSNKTDIPTRSYTGLGGNIGLDGESTTIGDGAFSLLGRTAFSKNVSLHTSTVFSNDSVSAFALTFGIPIYKSSGDRLELVYPFIGGGIAIENVFDDFNTDGLLTAGVDVPITERIVTTGRINVGFADDDTDVGLLLGVGYNFSILELF